MSVINCKGKLLGLSEPRLMGIINATPDSFYEGYLPQGNAAMLSMAGKMISDGADILDIGGQSTKPGSRRIPAQQELDRVLPVIEAVHAAYPDIIISIDTYSSEVARAAVAAGASIVNDISGGNLDEAMMTAVAELKVPYVCMHMQGTPATMQQDPVYNDVVQEVLDHFIIKLEECHKAGIIDVLIDPGFGFGKTIEHNFRLLKNLSVLSITRRPILAGLSRKGTIYKTLGVTATEALNGTTVLNTMALLNGASILRVHDVKEAKETIRLFNAYKKAPR
ncbi:MAG TPA: dihydropteroate synthase [Ferruginibacter sp.]|nr:dihydropteroate synthase [Ferruginibacter sp.]